MATVPREGGWWAGPAGREYRLALVLLATMAVFDTLVDSVRFMVRTDAGRPLPDPVLLLTWCGLWAAVALPLQWAGRDLARGRGGVVWTVLVAPLLAVVGAAIHIVVHPAVASILPGDMTYMSQLRFYLNAPGIVLLELTTGLTILLVGYATRSRAHAEREALEAARLEAGLARERLEAVRRRLAPHFLMNALNSVTGLVQTGEREAAARMIARIGRFLSRNLREESRLEIPLSEELEILDEYLSIEEVRLGRDLRFRARVAPELEAALVPPFLLQPLAENVLVHGLSDGARVEIRVVARPWRVTDTNGGVESLTGGSGLELAVEDSGPGWPDELREGTGLGVTREQLGLRYGDAAELITDRSPELGGARVRIRIPTWRPS